MYDEKGDLVMRNTTRVYSEIMAKFVLYCEMKEESTDDLIDQIDPDNLRIITKEDFMRRIEILGIQIDENDFNEIMQGFGTPNHRSIDMNQLFDEINRKNFAINEKKLKRIFFQLIIAIYKQFISKLSLN